MANASQLFAKVLQPAAQAGAAAPAAARVSQQSGTNSFAGPYNYAGTLNDSNNPISTEISGEGLTELAVTAPNSVAARTAFFGNPDSDKAAFALAESLAEKAFKASPSGDMERVLKFASDSLTKSVSIYDAANEAKAIEGGGQLGVLTETLSRYAVIFGGIVAVTIVAFAFKDVFKK